MTIRTVLLSLAVLLVFGCEPAPEERIERAQEYFDQANYRAAVLELKNAIRSDGQNPESRLLFARASYQLADLPTAESEFVRTLELGRDDAGVWLGYGRSLFGQGKVVEALEKVVPNLDESSTDASVHVFLGDVYSTLGNLADADGSYRRALAIDESLDAALIGAAVVAQAKGDGVTARRYLDNAVELNPDSVLAWRALGNYLRFRQELDDAAEAYARSIAAETPATPLFSQFQTRASRASVLVDLRKFDEASVQVDELDAIVPGHPLIHFLRGNIAYGIGEYDVAQMELQQYMSMVPGDMRSHAIMGAVNFSQNHLRQAEAYLQRATRGNVGGQATRRLLAETQLRLRKPGDALASLELLEGEGSSDVVLLGMLGRAEIGLGNTDAAISYFEQSVAADPSNPVTKLSLAMGLLTAGEYEQAIVVLNDMPEEQDTGYRRESLLIAAHLKNGNQTAAIEEAERLVRDNPNDAAAHSIAGALQQSLGEFDAAKSRFQNAIDIDPKNIASLYGLARVAMEVLDDVEAEQWLRRAIDADSSFVPALISLSSLLSKNGRYAELRPVFDSAISANPSELAPRLLYARLAITNQNFAEALEIVAAAKEFHPDDSKIVHAEGLALMGVGQTESGLRALENAAGAAPDDAKIQFDLARARHYVGDYRGASTVANRYRELRPDDVRGLALQIDSLANSDRLDEARQVLSEFRANNEESATTLLLAGDLEALDGNPENALKNYQQSADMRWDRLIALRLALAYQATSPANATAPIEKWLSEHPDDSEMRRSYAQLLEQQGDSSSAVSEYEKIIEDGSDDPIALNNLAWEYAEAGRDGAVELAQRAHELMPSNGSITDTLGWILHRQGESEKALDLLREARQQSPNNPEIQYHLAAVLAVTGNVDEAKSELNELLTGSESFSSRALAEELAQSL